MSDKKICLIIPWFGRKNDYIGLFCRSAANSELLDVLFITDLDFSEYAEKYPNIRYLNCSAEQLEVLVREKTGYRPHLAGNALKLCDLRPCYGKLFEAQIGRYAYWAFGDCDLIYGDIEARLPKVRRW